MNLLLWRKYAIDILAIIGTVKLLSIALAYFSAGTQSAIQAASPHPVFKTGAVEDVGKAATSADINAASKGVSVADEAAYSGIDVAGFLL